ncbi:MAG: hypothetical protein NXH70_16275 [Hyphomonas sp.]|nr:hypothetical protein [Hyphomonas sp.]
MTQRTIQCPECGGTGRIFADNPHPCGRCWGNGRITQSTERTGARNRGKASARNKSRASVRQKKARVRSKSSGTGGVLAAALILGLIALVLAQPDRETRPQNENVASPRTDSSMAPWEVPGRYVYQGRARALTSETNKVAVIIDDQNGTRYLMNISTSLISGYDGHSLQTEDTPPRVTESLQRILERQDQQNGGPFSLCVSTTRLSPIRSGLLDLSADAHSITGYGDCFDSNGISLALVVSDEAGMLQWNK